MTLQLRSSSTLVLVSNLVFYVVENLLHFGLNLHLFNSFYDTFFVISRFLGNVFITFSSIRQFVLGKKGGKLIPLID